MIFVILTAQLWDLSAITMFHIGTKGISENKDILKRFVAQIAQKIRTLSLKTNLDVLIKQIACIVKKIYIPQMDEVEPEIVTLDEKLLEQS